MRLPRPLARADDGFGCRVGGGDDGAPVDAPAVSGLGFHVLAGETLLALLRRVEAGEDAELVYIEMYASAFHVKPEEEEEEGEE